MPGHIYISKEKKHVLNTNVISSAFLYVSSAIYISIYGTPIGVWLSNYSMMKIRSRDAAVSNPIHLIQLGDATLHSSYTTQLYEDQHQCHTPLWCTNLFRPFHVFLRVYAIQSATDAIHTVEIDGYVIATATRNLVCFYRVNKQINKSLYLFSSYWTIWCEEQQEQQHKNGISDRFDQWIMTLVKEKRMKKEGKSNEE